MSTLTSFDVKRQRLEAAMYSPDDLAELFRCSRRHVDRMAATGLIPAPLKLGRLVRWPKALIDTHLAAAK